MPKKILEGIVVHKRAEKTALVLVDRNIRHKKYGKIIKVSKRYHVHDDNNKLSIGDKIKIIESIPISRQKKWNVYTNK